MTRRRWTWTAAGCRGRGQVPGIRESWHKEIVCVVVRAPNFIRADLLALLTAEICSYAFVYPTSKSHLLVVVVIWSWLSRCMMKIRFVCADYTMFNRASHLELAWDGEFLCCCSFICHWPASLLTFQWENDTPKFYYKISAETKLPLQTWGTNLWSTLLFYLL
jgi:hypothetical protein